MTAIGIRARDKSGDGAWRRMKPENLSAASVKNKPPRSAIKQYRQGLF
jgi:hypothetical protein